MYRNFTLDIKSEHLFEVCSEKNLSLKNIKGRVIAGKKNVKMLFSHCSIVTKFPQIQSATF